LENFLEVGRHLKDRGKIVFFILGPSEIDWKGAIERGGFPVISGISILEMAGILKLSDQVLCNDTGVMHVSSAVGARTLALFGETDPALWKPPGDHIKALRSPDKKISSIRVEEVLSLLIPL
jgi:heptosyltransferase-2